VAVHLVLHTVLHDDLVLDHHFDDDFLVDEVEVVDDEVDGKIFQEI